MGFLAPWFLAGMAALGLPVWLHLLRKHKTTPLPFSSLMFFERRTQSSIKHKRLRYLVLFAARTLLVLLIVVAFAHPFVERRIPPRTRSNEVTVVAIDNSLSMRAGGHLAQAKEGAKALVSGLHVGERAQVLAFGSRVEAMSEVTDDHAPLNAAIDAIEPTDDRTSFAELARSARSIAQSLHLPLTMHLFSDMQQTGMPSNFNDLRLNADVKLEPHSVAKKEEHNFAVENVVAPRRVFDNKKTRVLATVAGFGTRKDIRNVTLSLNGRAVETKTVEVPESGRATVENQYARVVRASGNLAARAVLREVFETVDRRWRGLGTIPKSGFALRERFAAFNAERKFPIKLAIVDDPPECLSGEVLTGHRRPNDCPSFGTRCTPDKPLGATMVSSEGACAAYYRYRRREAFELA